MQELTLTTTEVVLKINGKEYVSKISDREIISMANDMIERFAELTKTQGDVKAVVRAANDALECIDKILGDGAVASISEGKPVSVRDSIRWLTAISRAANAEYSARLVDMYG